MEALSHQQRKTMFWVYAGLYSLSIGVSAGILSYLVVIASGPFYENGEAWELLAITWYFRGLPILLIGTVLSIFVFPKYYGAMPTTKKLAIYLTNVICVAAIVLGVTLMEVWT